MNNIEFKDLDFDEEAILSLYNDLEWTNYTKDKSSLFNGIQNSLFIKAAYDSEKLVGLIRVIGDSNTIIYIQDILVLKSHQRQGIGSNLINFVLERYKNVRQICLSTDITDKQKLFYESIGFIEYEAAKIKGFVLKK